MEWAKKCLNLRLAALEERQMSQERTGEKKAQAGKPAKDREVRSYGRASHQHDTDEPHTRDSIQFAKDAATSYASKHPEESEPEK